MRILCGDSVSFAYAPGFAARLEPLPDFLEKYRVVGRCAWDSGHNGWMLDAEHRFEVEHDGLSRTCRWCGAVQFKITEKVTHTVEKWIDPEAKGDHP